MDIMLKGRKTFMQSYNPNCIVISERKTNKETVYRIYSSLNEMRMSDRFAYNTAMARKMNLLSR